MTKTKSVETEDTSINFRLPRELKTIIKNKAQENKKTTSNYVRDLLERIHNGDYCHKQNVENKIKSFLFSKEFLQLLIWISKKNRDSKCVEDVLELNGYVKTLKRVDGNLPSILVGEFDKVLNSVLILRSDELRKLKKYEFINSIQESKKFNFEKIDDFFLNNSKFKEFIEMKGEGVVVPKLPLGMFPKK
ncbi:hypothetical protein ACW5R3_12395 [Bizionia sp. KMM 8389]